MTEEQKIKARIRNKKYRDKNKKQRILGKMAKFSLELFSINGITRPIKEWAEIYQINLRILYRRVNEHDLDLETALKRKVLKKTFGKSKEEKCEINRQRARNYKLKNRELINQKRASRHYKDQENKRYNDRYKNDIFFRIKQNARRRFHKAMERAKNGKLLGTMDTLGERWDKIIKYLESLFEPGMTWENYGSANSKIKKWQIDHIKPCDAFNLADKLECKKCFHFTNIKPMWAIENAIKNNSWSGVDSHIDITAQLDTNGNIIRNLDYNI